MDWLNVFGLIFVVMMIPNIVFAEKQAEKPHKHRVATNGCKIDNPNVLCNREVFAKLKPTKSKENEYE